MVAAGCVTVFVTVEPRQGQATLAPSAPDQSPRMPMGTLEGRDLDLRIEATPDGTRYTVVDGQGVVIAERLTLDNLAERYPSLAPGGFYANEHGEPLGPLMIVPDDGTP